MKKILVLITLFAVLLCSCGEKGAARPETTSSDTASSTTMTVNPQTTSESTIVSDQKVSDYFPFVSDVHMKYKGIGNEYAQYDTYVDFIKGDSMQIRKNNGGTELVQVYAIRDGALISTFSRGETYFRFDYTAMSGKEEILLKEPLEAGNSWTLEDGSTRSITAVDKQIETPAGKFSAIEVTTKRKDASDKDYYVKDIGLVMSVYNSDDGAMTVTSELEKLEKDVPFKKTVRFYFPQFNSDRIVYIEREIALKTNEDMKWQFQKELKTIPEIGGLTKTLTTNTQVLGFSIDDEKETVTIDLSSDFINEMNAGTTLELMLINSIANTIGDYYLKDKVIILIDGKSYESGHILMKQGEAFDVSKEGVVQYK